MMDLDHVTRIVFNKLQEITGNAHNMINIDNPVTYPYLTFELTNESIHENADGFYLDIDIFDKSLSTAGVDKVETDLRNGLKRLQFQSDKGFFQFDFNNSTPIRTNDEDIKRRNVRFYIRVVWEHPYDIQRQ